nr:PREDICTED: P2Y purinoceptor 1-like [Paralichthys olivaceus]
MTVVNEEPTSFACKATVTFDEDGVVCLRTLGLSDGAEILMVMEVIKIPEADMVLSKRAIIPPELFSEMVKSWTISNSLDQQCDEEEWDIIWYGMDVFILITGVVANAALLWLFLMERKSLSASKVLGLNLAVMDLIFLSTVPLGLIQMDPLDIKNQSVVIRPSFIASNPLEKAAKVCSIFNLMGCPLLLTCMCVERYLAVMRPVLYLQVRKWEYRVDVSAAVWAITLVFVVATILVPDETIILLPVSIILSCLFILMLACLGSVIRSLQQQSPAITTIGKKGCTESTLKRQAVLNVLIVVVPAVISYLPVLVMSPLVLNLFYNNIILDRAMCNVFELYYLFPRLGVFIGPMFYFSKARQMCCLNRTQDK